MSQTTQANGLRCFRSCDAEGTRLFFIWSLNIRMKTPEFGISKYIEHTVNATVLKSFD